MTGARAVRALGDSWRAAVAELPSIARPSTEVTGSVVVITGEVGWGSRLRRAVDDGAAGIVLADPWSASVDEVLEAQRRSSPVPVVVERSRLRSDVAATALTSDPAVVQVELGASRQELEVVLRDAVGWARVLAGGQLDLVDVHATARGVTALLQRSDAAAGRYEGLVTLLATRAGASSPWIRATALGVERTEVTVDGRTSVVRTSEDGARQLPTRFESSARLALRRAIGSLEDASTPTDLPELDHDSRVAAAVLGARSSE
jgi:hypothetical protein